MRPEPRLAGWWSRVAATLIDWAVAWGIALAAFTPWLIAAVVLGGTGHSGSVLLLALVLGSTVFNALLMARGGEGNGQTLGKRALELRVVRADGKPIGFWLALVREGLLKIVVDFVLFGIGWIIDSLWPLGDRRHRALHDLVVGTQVVKAGPEPARILAPQRFVPEIGRRVYEAQVIDARIREAVGRGSYPEVGGLVSRMHESAVCRSTTTERASARAARRPAGG